jgi:hypothetical protein
LNSHRGKGTQKIVVERVNVHPGGQAIVGTVESRGDGGRTKLEEQPHEPITDQLTCQPGDPMPCTVEDRTALPESVR